MEADRVREPIGSEEELTVQVWEREGLTSLVSCCLFKCL